MMLQINYKIQVDYVRYSGMQLRNIIKYIMSLHNDFHGSILAISKDSKLMDFLFRYFKFTLKILDIITLFIE